MTDNFIILAVLPTQPEPLHMSQRESSTEESPKGQPTKERTRRAGPQTSLPPPPHIRTTPHKEPIHAEPGKRYQHEVAKVLHDPSCIYETDCWGPMPLGIKALISFMLPRIQVPHQSLDARGTPPELPHQQKNPLRFPSSTPATQGTLGSRTIPLRQHTDLMRTTKSIST